MNHQAITLTEKQVQWLDMILLDKDKEDALKYLDEVIKAQLKAQDHPHCGSHKEMENQ